MSDGGTRTCPNCGAGLNSGIRWERCWGCGVPLSAPAVAAQLADPEAEVALEAAMSPGPVSMPRVAAPPAPVVLKHRVGATHNRIFRANMSGGLVGWLGGSSKRSLANTVAQANSDGYEVVFVVRDTMNVLQALLYMLILVVTLLIWCPAPGYLVIGRRA